MTHFVTTSLPNRSHIVLLAVLTVVILGCQQDVCRPGPPASFDVSRQFLDAYSVEEGAVIIGDDAVSVQLAYEGVAIDVEGVELAEYYDAFPSCGLVLTVRPGEVSLQGAPVEPEAMRLAWGPHPDATPLFDNRWQVVWTPLARNLETSENPFPCDRLVFPMHHIDSGEQIVSECVIGIP